MAAAPLRLPRSLADSALERRAQLTSPAWAGAARRPRQPLADPQQAASPGWEQTASLAPAPRPSLGLRGPVLPALRPAGRSAGAPRLARRRRRSGAGALPQLGLAGWAPDSPSLLPGPRSAAEAAVQTAAGRPLCWPGLRALASSLPALPPAPSGARGV